MSTPASAPPRHRLRAARVGLGLEIVAGLAILVVLVLVGGVLIGSRVESGTAMGPALPAGTSVWVKAGTPGRGAVVLIEPDAQWSGAVADHPSVLDQGLRALRLQRPPQGSRMLTRVIGVPGDEVQCCSLAGKVTVNGTQVPVPVPQGAGRFRVIVPEGHYFVATDSPSTASTLCYLGSLRVRALVSSDRIRGVAVRVGTAQAGRVPGAEPYQAVPAPGQAPAEPIIEVAKDPRC